MRVNRDGGVVLRRSNGRHSSSVIGFEEVKFLVINAPLLFSSFDKTVVITGQRK